ncbi:hypothetical protein KVT40_005090 [Elsinoe batatas]|uniref:Major facilitator superfamily (MFS) profile domain-containing protein n=1 Tax=Elsinoe batatas TaxID=2601811 RepID=A0A8K0L1Y3_9PEZI|nr:hypothetical protein KVT40_005090 [Elsinoe batatas]
MLYAGRFIAGLGVGLLTMIIPIFQAEISHRRIRGRVTCLQQLFNALGQIFAAWIGYGCYVIWTGTGNSSEWRVPLAMQIVPAFILGGLIYLFPESPRWLCDNGYSKQGLRNLALLHSQGDETDPYVVAEYDLIHNQIADERSQSRITYLDLFRDWPNVRRMIIVTMIQAECQMTGISSLMFNGVNAVIAFAGTATCILVVDKIGRRPLEIWGAVIMCATFIVNANLIKLIGPLSLLTWLFNYVFFVTSGPLSWAIPAELFSGPGVPEEFSDEQ